jgi:hypothetical protein
MLGCNIMRNNTMSNIVAKHPWVFSFLFFKFFFVKGERERALYFHWNYILDKGVLQYFVWKIECVLSEIKEGDIDIHNLYIKFLKVVNHEVSYRSSR